MGKAGKDSSGLPTRDWPKWGQSFLTLFFQDSFFNNCMPSSSTIQFFKNRAGKPCNKEKIKKIMKLEPGFPVFREAVAAIDRAAFCWFKRHFAFFPTV
jgi:hypothetical protein